MFKIVQYNSIHNHGNGIEYDTTIVKIIASYTKAIEIAMKLKSMTGKLYKVERV